MHKIIEKSYNALLYIFFVLFLLLIRIDANDKKLMFAICLLVGSLVLGAIPFFTNRCKKANVRTWYLVSMSLLSLVSFIFGIYFLLFGSLGKYQLYRTIFYWIRNIAAAFALSSIIYCGVFVVKDFFKKGYQLEKFDLQAIQMLINTITFALIIYFTFGGNAYKIHEVYDSITYACTDAYITFVDFTSLVLPISIISGVYLVIYIILEVIKYYKFERDIDKSNNIYK